MLAVWLPLINGNRNNLGIINIGTATTGASIVSGKLGDCYLFTRTSHHLLIYTLPTELLSKMNNHSFGVAAWIKTTSDGSWLYITYGMGFYCNSFRLYNTSGTIYSSASSGSASNGSWHHVAYTYDVNTNKMTCYRDGVKVGENTYTLSQSYASSWNNSINIARNPNNNTDSEYFDGCILDVRIWCDECPSELQIKEVSQGLIAHYPLDSTNVYEKMINIDPLKNVMINNTTFPVNCSSGMIINEKTVKDGFECFHVKAVANPTSWWGCYNLMNPLSYGALVGDTVTRSYYIYVPENSILCRPSIEGNSSNKQYVYSNNRNKWERWSLTGTITDTGTNNYLMYFGSDGGNHGQIETEFYVRDILTEINNHATPYTMQNRPNGIIYDSSGYNNNLIITSSSILNIDKTSPRYDSCLKFNGLSGAVGPSPFGVGAVDELTVSFWHKPNSSTGTYNVIVGDSSPHSGFWMNLRGENPIWYYGGNWYVRSNAVPINVDTWYHIVLTYKNNTYQFYVNGQPITTNTGGTFKPPTFTENITIGCPTTTAGSSSSDYRQYGSTTDVRFYATALSEDDIKALYQEAAFIDHKGNIGCYLFYEDADSQITKTGQVKTEEFEEISDLSDGVAKVYELKIECNQLIEI